MTTSSKDKGVCVAPGTPLPWAHDTGPALSGRYHTVEDANEDMVCELYEGTDEQREANARYIVTACNAFPELVAALREARGQVVGFMLECGHSPDAAVANVARLDAAIARATGAA